MEKIDIAFIGGSGLYKIPNLKNTRWVNVKSNFGFPSSKICVGKLNDKNIAFLPRHGMDHNISPSKINYRANIEVLKIIGTENIISLSAVGSLREDYKPGDFVVVVNAEKIHFSGKKWEQKKYTRYTGWPGLRVETAQERRERHPERILSEAVRRMLPKNKLGRQMLSKLKVYSGPEHPHQAQDPQQYND